MIKADAGKFGKGNGENGEIHPGHAKAEREKSDHRAASGRDRHRPQQSEPWSDAEAREQEGRDISTEADIDRVSKRQLSGEAHHDVPGLAGVSEIENDNENGDEIVVDDP